MDETTPAGSVPSPSSASPASPPAAADAGALAAEALQSAQKAVTNLSEQAAGPSPSSGQPSPLDLPKITPPGGAPGAPREAIDLLADVNLHVKIELGRTRMLVEDVLRLGEGSVVELDKLAGDPVDVYVNDRPVARGEVLVLNDNFCVRINEIVSQAM
ncbi:MAG: flagellar motor switch protein FliN [Phycisphaerales bacterium]|nr:flagellar motor switch protein FliN [Phycisphaerales bacterium]